MNNIRYYHSVHGCTGRVKARKGRCHSPGLFLFGTKAPHLPLIPIFRQSPLWNGRDRRYLVEWHRLTFPPDVPVRRKQAVLTSPCQDEPGHRGQ
jgi:hypothetical protein